MELSKRRLKKWRKLRWNPPGLWAIQLQQCFAILIFLYLQGVSGQTRNKGGKELNLNEHAQWIGIGAIFLVPTIFFVCVFCPGCYLYKGRQRVGMEEMTNRIQVAQGTQVMYNLQAAAAMNQQAVWGQSVIPSTGFNGYHPGYTHPLVHVNPPHPPLAYHIDVQQNPYAKPPPYNENY